MEIAPDIFLFFRNSGITFTLTQSSGVQTVLNWNMCRRLVCFRSVGGPDVRAFRNDIKAKLKQGFKEKFSSTLDLNIRNEYKQLLASIESCGVFSGYFIV